MYFFVKTIFIFLFSLGGTLFVLPRLMHIASTFVLTKEGSSDVRLSLMDSPDDRRKIHVSPKPLVGGIGMLGIVCLSSILFVTPEDLNLRGYYSAVLLLGITGFLDDFKEIHHKWKFIIQILAVTLMFYYSRTELLSFGNLLSFGSIDFGFFAIAPVTIFCTIGVINSINMIDGLDGLAGGIALAAFIAFSVLAYINQQTNIMLLSISLSGVAIGFLRYNWHPSKLFMGDAGSFFLGFSLAFLSLYITQKSNTQVPPVAALLILTVPIVDTITVIVKRIIKGRSPFGADKNHFHHMLLRRGMSVPNTAKTIICISTAFSLLGIIGTVYKISEYYLFLVFLTYFIIYLTVSFFIKE